MSELAERLDCIEAKNIDEADALNSAAGLIRAQRALTSYYKEERKRSEDCLANILTIICDGGTDFEQIGKITDLLTHHYSRSSCAERNG